MTVAILLFVMAVVFVAAVTRILGVPLLSPRTDPTGGAKNEVADPAVELRRASTRLVVALLALSAGTALLIFLTVRWILRALEGILS